MIFSVLHNLINVSHIWTPQFQPPIFTKKFMFDILRTYLTSKSFKQDFLSNTYVNIEEMEVAITHPVLSAPADGSD